MRANVIEIQGPELTVLKRVAEALAAVDPKRPNEASLLRDVIKEIEQRPDLTCG
jgi:hypothetical protein